MKQFTGHIRPSNKSTDRNYLIFARPESIQNQVYFLPKRVVAATRAMLRDHKVHVMKPIPKGLIR